MIQRLKKICDSSGESRISCMRVSTLIGLYFCQTSENFHETRRHSNTTYTACLLTRKIPSWNSLSQHPPWHPLHHTPLYGIPFTELPSQNPTFMEPPLWHHPLHCTPSQHTPWTDKHFWKHYLPATCLRAVIKEIWVLVWEGGGAGRSPSPRIRPWWA